MNRKQSSSPQPITTNEKAPATHSSDDEDNEYNKMFKKNNSEEKPELDSSSSRPKTRRGRQDTFDVDEQGNASNKSQPDNDVWKPSSELNKKEPVDPLIGLDDLQDQTARSTDQKNPNSIPSSTTNDTEDQFKNWYPKNDDDDE
jgi:hypothetical protein